MTRRPSLHGTVPDFSTVSLVPADFKEPLFCPGFPQGQSRPVSKPGNGAFRLDLVVSAPCVHQLQSCLSHLNIWTSCTEGPLPNLCVKYCGRVSVPGVTSSSAPIRMVLTWLYSISTGVQINHRTVNKLEFLQNKKVWDVVVWSHTSTLIILITTVIIICFG